MLPKDRPSSMMAPEGLWNGRREDNKNSYRSECSKSDGPMLAVLSFMHALCAITYIDVGMLADKSSVSMSVCESSDGSFQFWINHHSFRGVA